MAVYFLSSQNSNADIIAGRQPFEQVSRMYAISEGVKGLLRMRSESFVVWALSILHESESRASGCGGLLMGGCGVVRDRRAR